MNIAKFNPYIEMANSYLRQSSSFEDSNIDIKVSK